MESGHALNRFRHRHVLRYNILLLICLVLHLPGWAALLWIDTLHPFLLSLCLGIGLLMAATIFFLLRRRQQIARCLALPDLNEAEHALTAFVEDDQKTWHRTTVARMFTGALLLGGYFLVLVTGTANRVAVMLPSFFILLVVMSILRNWLIFLDQLFLQDVIHANRS